MNVTPTNYPLIYASLTMIAQAASRMPRYAGVADVWDVPAGDDARLAQIETALAQLAPDDFETLCLGEHGAVHDLIVRYDLYIVHAFLSEFFDDWTEPT